MLPDSISGHELQRFSGTAVDVGTGGDVCMIFCPGELHSVAEYADVPVAEVTWAVAFMTTEREAIVLRAIDLPGAREDRVDAWLKMLATSGDSWSSAQRTIEGRTVTVAVAPLRSESDGVQYIVAVGDVLFVFAGQPAAQRVEDEPPQGILEALRYLPR